MTRTFYREVISLGFAAFVLGGCSGLVSKDGPTAFEIRGDADVAVGRTARTLAYATVALSPSSVAASNAATLARTPGFPALASRTSSTDVRIGTGDIINLTIYEAQPGGLFIPQDAGTRPGNFVSIPNQQVDAGGNITVPYAGTVQVVGRTAREVSAEITKKLTSRAIEPQVVVSISERRGNEVSVLGEVGAPLRFSMDPGGIRLLSAIARAGGPRTPPYETIVTLQRQGRTYQAAMTAVVKIPSQNIVLTPGDVVYVSREPKVFMAFGATPSPGSIGGTNNRRFVFDEDNITLSEAVAKAGGLATERADASAVFIFRLEPKDVLRRVGVDVSQYENDLVPTIYTANWEKADGFFLASTFNMRDKDIIFVSEHPTTDITKFANIISSVSAPVVNGSAVYTATR